MRRCLELALLAEGDTAPNPMVGAVVVCDDRIIGEGYHRVYGQPHAEVNAIASVKDRSLLKKSTIYVSLEPCSHYGKTPPCADLIIASEIPRVVIGTIDPFAKVAGRGVKKLRDAGIEVEIGILEKECLALNRRFFTFHEQKRPFVILKWAQTLDGFMDIDRTHPEFGHPTWISNELSRRLVHKQRTTESAILIGTDTAFKDNPSLTVREWSGKQPIRMVIDRENRLPNQLNLKDGKVPTYIFTEADSAKRDQIEWIHLDFKENIIPQIFNVLYERQLQSVIIEGGKQLLQSVLDYGVWDEAYVYSGKCWFGSGVAAPKLTIRPTSVTDLNGTYMALFQNSLKS